MPEYFYVWLKANPLKFSDPLHQCCFVKKNGGRCKRKTTTIYCNQHAEIMNLKAKGLHPKPKD